MTTSNQYPFSHLHSSPPAALNLSTLICQTRNTRQKLSANFVAWISRQLIPIQFTYKVNSTSKRPKKKKKHICVSQVVDVEWCCILSSDLSLPESIQLSIITRTHLTCGALIGTSASPSVWADNAQVTLGSWLAGNGSNLGRGEKNAKLRRKSTMKRKVETIKSGNVIVAKQQSDELYSSQQKLWCVSSSCADRYSSTTSFSVCTEYIYICVCVGVCVCVKCSFFRRLCVANWPSFLVKQREVTGVDEYMEEVNASRVTQQRGGRQTETLLSELSLSSLYLL